MEIRKIPTENPRKEQWQLLGQFGYPKNAAAYLNKKATVLKQSDFPEYISGCINQGFSYFNAFSSANLDISPLLLYYGVANLMFGASTLVAGDSRQINHHGMKLRKPAGVDCRIADFEIRPCNENDGALQWFIEKFSDGTAITHYGSWSLEEIFGSIPDLLMDFKNCYPTSTSYAVPISIEPVGASYREEKPKKKMIPREIVSVDDLSCFENPRETLLSIPGFRDAYLEPTKQQVPQFELYRKLHAEEIGIYTIYGRKHLEIPHIRGVLTIAPGQAILFFMGLFALGHISRYYPQFWNIFVRGDTTGERLVVDRFLSLAERYIPNLVLNRILNSRVEFYHPGNPPPASATDYSFD